MPITTEVYTPSEWKKYNARPQQIRLAEYITDYLSLRPWYYVYTYE